MRGFSALRVAAVAAGIALMATGCGATGKTEGGPSTTGASSGPLTGLRIMVPNTPGGGYDTTARAAAKVLEDESSPPAPRSSTWPAPAAPSAWPASSTRRATATWPC